MASARERAGGGGLAADELATETAGRRAEGGPAPLFVVRVTKGPDTGRSLVLDWNATPEVRVGKSQASELCLSDPRVSRRHLVLRPDGDRVRLVDTASSNGTRVGGVDVVEARLQGGEVIDLGDSSLKLARAGSLAPGAGAADHFGRVLGSSPDMVRVFGVASRLAPSPLSLLVEGEIGTGKALLAEAIHEASPQARGPLAIFECGAASPDEEAAALLGPSGVLARAAGGTLVLHEIGNLALAAQSRLAAALRRAPARVIATTRRDLEVAVNDGTLLEELLFRVAGARIALPPLRRRPGDVELLSRHFWQLYGGGGEPPRSFVLLASRHEWPGNVRELEQAVARRIALGDDRDAAGPSFRELRGGGDPVERVLAMDLAMPAARQLVVEDFERRYVERALDAHGGNVSRAAAASGLTRRYFHMLLAKRR